MSAVGVTGGPGAGSVESIGRAASTRSQKADDLERAAFDLRQAADWAAGSWKGRSGEAFVASTADVAAELRGLAAGLEHQTSTLQTYGRAVEAIQAEVRVLEARRTMAQTSLALAAAHVEAIRREAEHMVAADPTGLASEEEYRRGEKSMWERRADEDRHELLSVDRAWDDLVEERAVVDRRCVTALHDPVVMGRLPSIREAAVATASPEQLLALLGGLSRTDLALLLQDHPELVDVAFRADPERVRAWWDELGRGSVDDDGMTAAQAALIAGAPAIIGALDGVPPVARVLANRLNAERRVDEIDLLLAGRSTPGPSTAGEDAAGLMRERAYLAGAVSEPPVVQLYLFDPAADRIVEMIGEWGATTSSIITYVPGTGARLDSFYGDPREVQQVSDWFASRDEGYVAFVYKDGRFPQNLLEANLPARALPTGAQLASFQAGLRQSYDPGQMNEIAIGHSWGLANVTSSEVAGARYDHVVSLAGAGMPSAWEPRDGTTYSDYRYLDALHVAQWTGQVWNGKNPGQHWAFERDGLFSGPDDHELALTRDLERKAEILVENHTLIASSDTANHAALDAMALRVEK